MLSGDQFPVFRWGEVAEFFLKTFVIVKLDINRRNHCILVGHVFGFWRSFLSYIGILGPNVIWPRGFNFRTQFNIVNYS